MQLLSSRKGSVTGGWGSPTGMYQAIYEKNEDIPPVKDPALTRGSVSASIDSHNHIEYYTSHILEDKGRGSENPDENSSSIQRTSYRQIQDATPQACDLLCKI
ncbi:uncharacterized protein LOC144673328 [Cetorhinus maximus]